MAWRGSARAAGQRLPEGVFTTAPPGAPHSALPPACTHTHHDLLGEAQQAPGRSWRGVELGGDREAKTQAGSSHRSPRRGGGQRIYLVEMEEGAEESSSPKVAAAELAGVGRNRQAMTG
jgi:hypothetical protein